MQIRDQIRSIPVGFGTGSDIHSSGHLMGHHGVHHGVPLAANGQPMMMEHEDFFHEQDPHDMNERLMSNFRQNHMPGGGFNQSRM